MNVRIRKATMADIGPLIELLYELFSIETDFTFDKDKQYQGLKLMLKGGKNRRVWVADDKQHGVVGMCTLQILISTAEGGEVGLVEDVVVKKEFRCQGIGTLLLKTVEAWAAKSKLSRLQLLKDKTNLPAIQFYKKVKWQPTMMVCMRKVKR
jgi:GNAT superfamily N-acetyltransferase